MIAPQSPVKAMKHDLPPIDISSSGKLRPPSAPLSPESPANPRDGLDSARNKNKNGSKISSFLKGLFVTKPSESGDAPADAHQVQTSSSPGSQSRISSSAVPLSISTTKPTPAAEAILVSPRGTAAAGASKLAQASSPRPHHPAVTFVRPGALASDEVAMLAVAAVLPPKMARASWSLKDYAIVEKMYTGYASTVYKAWCKASGETVCLKAYNMANLCELNQHQIYREVKLHSALQHENIIALYAAFQQGNQVVLVQEYADSGDLFLMLHKYGGKVPEKTAVEMILHPFLNVLSYLHQNCIVHRDIKPENVLFSRTMQLKLCDFGLAINLREERAVTRAGTLEYMAPEVLDCPFKNRPEENKEKTHLHYNLTVDTWAVGVLAYELLVGFPPFNDKQKSAIEDKIRRDAPRFPSSMSEPARSFMLQALQKSALDRPTILDLLNHKWIRSNRRQVKVVGGVEEPATPPSADPLIRLQNKMLLKNMAAAPVSGSSGEMRTQDGDLLQAMPSYLSFSAGMNRPKLPMLDSPPKPKAAAAAPTSPTSSSAAHYPDPHPPTSPMKPALKDKRFAGVLSGGSGMSFTSSQNPRLQVLKGLSKGDHL